MVQTAGRDPCEVFEETDPRDVRVGIAHGVEEPVGLRVRRRDDAGVPVPGQGDAEARSEVDQTVAVGVPDVRAHRAVPDDRVRVRESELRGPSGPSGGDRGALVAREDVHQTDRARAGQAGGQVRELGSWHQTTVTNE